MNRKSLLTHVHAITRKLDASLDANTSDEAAKAIARSELGELRNAVKDSKRVLAYLYGFLVDSDAVTANKATSGLLNAYAEELLQNDPALKKHVDALRQFPARLLPYIALLAGISLSEWVRAAKPETIDEKWLDPITGQIMEIPVRFYIDGKATTLDLFTLLHNSDSAFGLRTPQRQYVYLNDLYPDIELVNNILHRCRPPIPSDSDGVANLQHALNLVRANDLPALAVWADENPGLILLEVQDQEGLGTLLHYACRHNHFDLAVCLMEKGAYLFQSNRSNKCPGDFIDASLLDAAIANNPTNYGLRLLKAGTHYPPVPPKDLKIYYENLEFAAQKGFVPALVQNGTSLCAYPDPKTVIRGIRQLRAAMRMNSDVAAKSLCAMYDKVFSPGLKQQLDSEQRVAVIEVTTAGLNMALASVIQEGDRFNELILARDLMAFLASDVYILERSYFEDRVASTLNKHSVNAAKGYDLVKALLFACKAYAPALRPEFLVTLESLFARLGLAKEGRELVAKMHRGPDLGVLLKSNNDAMIFSARVDEAIQDGNVPMFAGLALKQRRFAFN